MLTEEANETSEAMKLYQEKINDLQHQLITEQDHHRRQLTLLNEELNTYRSSKETHTIEMKHLHDKNTSLSSQITQLNEKISSLSISSNESSQENINHKMKINNLELILKQKDNLIKEMKTRYDLDVKNMEEKLVLKYDNKLMLDRLSLEHKSLMSQSQQENMLIRSSQEMMRTSLENISRNYQLNNQPTSSSMSSLLDLSLELIKHKNTPPHDMNPSNQANNPMNSSDYSSKQQINSHLDQNSSTYSSKSQIDARVDLEVSKIEQRLQIKHENEVKYLKSKLIEAGNNIDRLKTMLNEYKGVIDKQKVNIDELKAVNSIKRGNKHRYDNEFVDSGE